MDLGEFAIQISIENVVLHKLFVKKDVLSCGLYSNCRVPQKKAKIEVSHGTSNWAEKIRRPTSLFVQHDGLDETLDRSLATTHAW